MHNKIYLICIFSINLSGNFFNRAEVIQGAVPWLRPVVARLSAYRPTFNYRPVHVQSVVEEEHQVFSK
jgi:hypothetical protein